MKGWTHITGMDRQGLVEAREWFQKAIEMDGRLAPAYSGLAGAHIWETTLSWSLDPKHSLAEALGAAQRAVGLDEADGEAHAWLSYVSIFSVPTRRKSRTSKNGKSRKMPPAPRDFLVRTPWTSRDLLRPPGRTGRAIDLGHCHKPTYRPGRSGDRNSVGIVVELWPTQLEFYFLSTEALS